MDLQDIKDQLNERYEDPAYTERVGPIFHRLLMETEDMKVITAIKRSKGGVLRQTRLSDGVLTLLAAATFQKEDENGAK